MEPSFGRSRIVAFDRFSLEIHCQQLALCDQGEGDPRAYEKEIAIGNAGANMTKSLDQFFM
jgi:hypothetical protein